MDESDLHFSPASSNETGSYRLVELTPDFAALVDAGLQENLDLKCAIKGHANEDAVLCTADKTFTMRSIVLSNTILVATPAPQERASNYADRAVMIRDQLNEIVELAPVVPNLHKLSVLLRNKQYDESQEEENAATVPFTYQDALEQIQASEKELKQALKEKRILILHDELRPIAPTYLVHLLELILNLLASLSLKHDSVPVETLFIALATDHDLVRAVSEQVISWFGETTQGKWAMDVPAVVKEIGLGILRSYRQEPIQQADLLATWKSRVGDLFESFATLELLRGNYIETDKYGSKAVHLKYFPASALPMDPPARFSELFLTRSKWRAEEIGPFLADIALNDKERDKFLLKYCRTVSDVEGIKYTARAQYTG